jgi:hypothetical protein
VYDVAYFQASPSIFHDEESKKGKARQANNTLSLNHMGNLLLSYISFV